MHFGRFTNLVLSLLALA